MSTGIASPVGPPTSHVQDGDAGHEHRQRREHERRPEDRADADLVRRLAGREQDRDDRDHRLGQGRPDRREDGPDGALGELELAPEPLDAVGEQLGAEQDDDEGEDQDERCPCASDGTSDAIATPTAMTPRIATRRPRPCAIRRPRRSRRAATTTRPIGVAMTTISPSHRKPAGSSGRSDVRPSVAGSKVGPPVQRRDPVGDHQRRRRRRGAPTDDVGHRDRAGGRSAARSAYATRDGRSRSSERPQQHLDRRVEQDDDEQEPQVAQVDPVAPSATRASRRGRRRSRSGRRRTGRSRRGAGR